MSTARAARPDRESGTNDHVSAGNGFRSHLANGKRALVRAACRVVGCAEAPTEGPELMPQQIGHLAEHTYPGHAEDPEHAGPAVVVAEALTKVYADGVIGAQDIDITAHTHEIVAVVGPNGAGKSTTLNMLSGLLHPTHGRAVVGSVPIVDTKRLGTVLGVGLQTSGLDPTMTAREHLEIQAALYRMRRDLATANAVRLLNQLGLMPYVDRRVGQFSIGLQRRLVLALALIHDPQVVILDEPTAGLDPQSRRVVWNLLEQYRRDGRTILFSTQLLEEADLLAQRLYVISDGRVIAQGPPAQLREAYGTLAIRVRIAGTPDDVVGILAEKLPDLGKPRIDVDHLVYDTSDGPGDTARITAVLDEYGVDFLELSVGRPSLEDAFVRLTGSAIRPEPLLDNGEGGGTLCRCC